MPGLEDAAYLGHLGTCARSAQRQGGELASQKEVEGKGEGPHLEEEPGPEGTSPSLEFYNVEDIPSTEAWNRREKTQEGHGRNLEG